MDLKVQQTRVPAYRAAACETRRESFRADFVVTDTLPDVREIQFSEGEFCLWRLDVHDGFAEMEGEYTAHVVCAPEEPGEAFSVSVSVPVQMRFQNAQIAPGMRPVLACETTERNVTMLNSRKLRVQCLLSATLTGYFADDLTLTTALGESERGLHVKTEQMSVPVISDVTEQVFHVEDTVPLRAGVPADGRFLCRSSAAVLEEAKLTGDGVILCGRVVTEVWYLDADSKEILSEPLRTAFTQFVDIEPGDGALIGAAAQLHLTSAELRCRNDETAADVTYHLVAQTVCTAEVKAEIVTDAYCTHGALAPVFADLAGTENRQIVSATLEEADAQPSGVVLVRRSELNDLWQTAKRYGSSETAIRAANPETETPSKWVIIPRVV